MPGPYVHISAMRHASARLRAEYRPSRSERVNPGWPGESVTELGRLLQERPNFASLGAIGPDLFFFLPDFRDVGPVRISSVLIKVLDYLESLYEAVDPYVSKWEHYIGPASESLGEEMSRLTGGLSETVSNILGELVSLLTTKLEQFVTDQYDWWSLFSLGLNTGTDEQAFLWSDMLHYRRTGVFGRALFENATAREDEAERASARAYALGYISHLATDVTGHALVNAISGGPFRLHWQRHHLVENHMDCRWYLDDPESPRRPPTYPQFTESALYYDIAFREDSGDPVGRPSYPAGGTMRDNWARRRILDVDSEMPDFLADLLRDTMRDVFYQGADPKHPRILNDDGLPTAELIREAYRLLFRYLKFSTVDGFNHERPDPPAVFPNLDFPTATDPNDEPPDDGDDSFFDSLLDFLLSIFRVLAFIVEAAVWVATLPWAVLADLGTYPLRWALYWTLELPLFKLLKTFRAALVMTGYFHPMEDEIDPALVRIGNRYATVTTRLGADLSDVFGGRDPAVADVPDRPYRDPCYPHLNADDDFHHPWEYPSAATELAGTTASPYPSGASPAALFQGQDADPNVRDRLEAAAAPEAADAVGPDLAPTRHLGDSIQMSAYLIWLYTRSDGGEVVDWNLDADRGYGYQCWDWNRQAGVPGLPDQEGNLYLPPCVWPSQATAPPSLLPDARTVRKGYALKCHWVTQPDPGCEDHGPVIN